MSSAGKAWSGPGCRNGSCPDTPCQKGLSLMKLVQSLVLFIVLSPDTLAATHAYCWARTRSGLLCTSIVEAPSTSRHEALCAQKARSIGATAHGLTRSGDRKFLELQQDENCSYVDRLARHECFRESRCERGGEVVVSAVPIEQVVFAEEENPDSARKTCLQKASASYLKYLLEEGSGCLLGAKAVLTVPRLRDQAN